MKKILLILLSTNLLLACNAESDKEHKSETDPVVHEHTEAASALVLNNGNKWKADSITNHNVVGLKTTADMFRVQPFPSINNYQLLGTDLSKDLDVLLKECKMKGEDHEALHNWLAPILKQTNDLKNITDTAKAREIFKSVDVRIDAYRNFFY